MIHCLHIDGIEYEIIETPKLCEICGRYYEDSIRSIKMHKQTPFHKRRLQQQSSMKTCDICNCLYSSLREKLHMNTPHHKRMSQIHSEKLSTVLYFD